jgi:hypothetical protein
MIKHFGTLFKLISDLFFLNINVVDVDIIDWLSLNIVNLILLVV